MHRYLKIPGLIVGDTAPSADLLPEDLAMGQVPGWVCLFDPDYTEADGVYDRARPPVLAAIDASPLRPAPIAPLQNGEAGFAPSDSVWTHWNPQVAFPQDEWTVFFVSKPGVRTGAMQQSVVSPVSFVDDAAYAPLVSVSAGATRVQVARRGADGFDVESLRRVSATPDVAFKDRVSLVMATFSVTDGLRIFIDGVQAAHNPSDRSPLTVAVGAGEWRILRNTRGLYGMIGVLSIDLGRAENADHRASIAAFLMSKYGIT